MKKRYIALIGFVGLFFIILITFLATGGEDPFMAVFGFLIVLMIIAVIVYIIYYFTIKNEGKSIITKCTLEDIEENTVKYWLDKHHLDLKNFSGNPVSIYVGSMFTTIGKIWYSHTPYGDEDLYCMFDEDGNFMVGDRCAKGIHGINDDYRRDPRSWVHNILEKSAKPTEPEPKPEEKEKELKIVEKEELPE